MPTTQQIIERLKTHAQSLALQSHLTATERELWKVLQDAAGEIETLDYLVTIPADKLDAGFGLIEGFETDIARRDATIARLETALAARAAEVASLEAELEAHRNPPYTLHVESDDAFGVTSWSWSILRGGIEVWSDCDYPLEEHAKARGQAYLDALLAPFTPKGSPTS